MSPKFTGLQVTLLGLLTGATLLGAGWGAQAQTAPPAAPSPRTALPMATPPKRLPVKPLTAQENAALQALFTKLRPATSASSSARSTTALSLTASAPAF
ncbi:hypothetical protein [Deinococcus radiodurans]|uniref:hypothetical protein n=1 Tax=Deinococcus radiodurans TaxID=1299 RepID=UPI001F3FEA9B|nr:hypothetical protein [Deinococcus radiodurans]